MNTQRKPRIAIIIGSMRPTRFADKPAQLMLKQAQMRKYHLAFARDTGVAWDKGSTFNAAQGIAVTDVPAWLAQHKGA